MTELKMRSYRQKAALSQWTGPAIYHGIEIIPRTGLNLLRYKRRLRRMAAPVCPADKTWEVVLLFAAAVGVLVYAFLRWWFLW
jgi:hypothetical protein